MNDIFELPINIGENGKIEFVLPTSEGNQTFPNSITCIGGLFIIPGYKFLGYKYKSGIVRNIPFMFDYNSDSLISVSSNLQELKNNNATIIYAETTLWIKI
jgi:hypothetical protein